MAQDDHDPVKGAATISDTGETFKSIGTSKTAETGQTGKIVKSVETVHWVFAQGGAGVHDDGRHDDGRAAGGRVAQAGSAQGAGGAARPPAAVLRRTLPSREIFEQAADIIKAGGLVAFPTETVYGLGADAGNEQALRAIYAAKGRPADNPLIAHVAKAEQLLQLCQFVPSLAQDLIGAFWPGPLTITLPALPSIPRTLTGGLSNVAVRMPSHPVALALIRAADSPLAAPSANLSGRPSPTVARHVLADLAGRIDGVIDGGRCEVGIESTVIALEPEGGIVILRPGAIGPDKLSRFGVPVSYDSALLASDNAAPRAPGQKYRHYAPQAPVLLFHSRIQAAALEELERHALALAATGAVVAALTVSAVASPSGARLWLPLSRTAAVHEVARGLYGALRMCDDEGVDQIVLEGISGGESAAAVMNRMFKAAGNRMLEV